MGIGVYDRRLTWVFTRTLRDGDAALTVKKKQAFFAMSLCFTAFAAYTLMSGGFMPNGARVSLWVYVWTTSCMVWGAAVMLVLQVTRALPQALVNISPLFMSIFVAVPLDYNAELYMQPAMWPFFMIAADCALVFETPRWVGASVVGVAAVYLFFQQLATSGGSRLLYDPLNAGHRRVIPASCDCAQPPCDGTAVGGVVVYLGYLCIVLFNYYITAGFASAALAERAAMQAAAAAAEEVAECLADFDLDAARKALLAAEDRLPANLRSAFESILRNLQVYRPYLPMSCLPAAAAGTPPERGSSGEAAPLAAPPPRHAWLGGPVAPATATLVRTNLQNTMAWCTAPEHIAATFAAVVGCAVDVFGKHRGVVDAFLGDKVTASFNAARRHPGHAAAAARAAKAFHASAARLTGHGVNVAVATGEVVYGGDLGCKTLRRFTLLGGLPTHTAALERVGRLLGVDVLCNEACAYEIAFEHEVQCLPRRVRFAPCRDEAREEEAAAWGAEGGVPQQHPVDAGKNATAWAVFRILLPYDDRAVSPRRPSAGEWMYDLDSSPPAQWGPYNSTMMKFLNDGCADAALAAMAGDGKVEAMRDVLAAHGGAGPLVYRV